MSYMKDIPRRAKNGFRSGTTPVPKIRKIKWRKNDYKIIFYIVNF